MRILPVSNFSFQKPVRRQDRQERFFVGNRSNTDTVSFTGGNKMADCVEHSVSKNMDRLTRIATVYLDVLESVAMKLKNKGVYFDRAYCEKNPVKSPKSCTSKIVRSGSFSVPDIIRATLYMDNPYDLSVLNDELLPELAKRGYIIPKAEMSVAELKKRGYIPKAKETDFDKVAVPDLDIRLADVFDQRTKLKSEFRYAISKPQSSGYEDIQMRLVRTYDTKENPVQHELLILFGPEYSRVKQFESKYIYEYLRKFNELNFRNNNIGKNSYTKVCDRYIELIEKMVRGNISQKLYENAKNKDMFGITEDIPITFTEDDLKILEQYFFELNEKIIWFYRDAKKFVRTDKSGQNQLYRESKADRDKLQVIHDGLLDTIKMFMSEKKYDDILKATEEQPKKQLQKKVKKKV